MKTRETDDFVWEQFCRLGEMIGDGLHHEPDGKWITRDYNRLAKILVPGIKEALQAKRKLKADHVTKQISELIKVKKCSCGGELIQKRKGTKVVYCKDCNSRYKAISK